MTEQQNNDATIGGAAVARGRSGLRTAIYSVLGIAVLVGLFFAGRWFFTCPCDTMPGAVLWGEEVEEPVADWSFANEVELCQVQVQGLLFPQANNLNCMATPDGTLYLSCSNCEPKRWSRLARANENGKVRLDGRVYPVTLTQVTDPAEADRAWNARLTKLEDSTVLGSGTPVGTPRPPDAEWWAFRAVSRVE